jgi:hypothetical protein
MQEKVLANQADGSAKFLISHIHRMNSRNEGTNLRAVSLGRAPLTPRCQMAIARIPVIMFSMVAMVSVASTADGQVSDTVPFHVNAYLCETSQYAIEFAGAVSKGEEVESAKDIVGKAAKREVCGRYVGVASVQKQKIILSDGVLYRIIALRFKEDNKIAWTAEMTFAADSGSLWHL